MLDGDYEFTVPHFFEEMANDDLTFADIEQVIATGRINRRFTRDPRGARYEIIGTATDERAVAVICRIKETRKLLFITTYTVDMNNNNKKYNYGKCHVCGEQIRESKINQDFWIKGKLVVIESVPTGVCPQCGEKIVKADVGRQLANLLANLRRTPKRKTITVPVINYAKEAA